MIIVAIFAPLVLIVSLFTVAFMLDGAYRKGDKATAKFWGITGGVILAILLVSIWSAMHLNANF